MIEIIEIIAIIIITVTCTILHIMMNKFEKYRKLISIILIAIMLSLLFITRYLYTISHNTNNTEYLTNVIETIGEDFDCVNVEDVKGKGIDFIVRYINDNVLVNDKIKSLELDSVEDMFTFAEKYRNESYVSDWVRCFGKYTGWCLAEHSIKENCEDYWEMKYKASDKIASYNYGLLVSYKIEGFFTKYMSSIAFVLVFSQVYIYVTWVEITMSNLFKKWRNKSDLQK